MSSNKDIQNLFRMIYSTLNDRESTHGDKKINHKNIANFWNSYLNGVGILNKNIRPFDVAIMMCLLKIARIQTGKNNIDDIVDGIGYLAISSTLRE